MAHRVDALMVVRVRSAWPEYTVNFRLMPFVHSVANIVAMVILISVVTLKQSCTLVFPQSLPFPPGQSTSHKSSLTFLDCERI